jgi:hypothetical protein
VREIVAGWDSLNQREQLIAVSPEGYQSVVGNAAASGTSAMPVQGADAAGGTVTGRPVYIGAQGGAGTGTFQGCAISSYGSDGRTVTSMRNLEVTSYLSAYNESTADRWRGNTEGTAVSGGAYTSTAVGATLTNYNGRGVILHMDLTASAAVSGVTIQIQARDPASLKWQTIFADSSARTGVGTYRYIIYPGVATAGQFNALSNIVLPRTWRVTVVNLDGLSYTLSVGYQLVL